MAAGHKHGHTRPAATPYDPDELERMVTLSALDDLVQQLQAAVSSVESAQGAVTQAGSLAGEAVQAAAAFGREDDVQQVDALRADIDERAAALAGVHDAVTELLQRAAALQGG